jgi:hypothetical protein
MNATRRDESRKITLLMFVNKAQNYPNFLGYLRETEGVDPIRDLRGRFSIVLMVGLLAPLPYLVGNSKWIESVVLFATFFGLTYWQNRRVNAMITPEIESKIESLRVLATMRKMNQLNRLHRDLSEATLTVLDEVARTRLEIKHMLETPFWNRPDLSESHRTIKQQALNAADQAMMDAVMQFRASLPDKVQNRQFMDYVDEGVEGFMKSPRRRAKFAEVGFDSAFSIAQKLQSLRTEIEQITRVAQAHHGEVAANIPGGLVDLTMAEIRTMRQAEEELRQGL